MESKSRQLLASQVLPCFLLRDGSALHKPKHRGRAKSHESAPPVHRSVEQPGWKGSPRADGCTLALGAWAGGEGNWVGISSTELEKTGKKQEILAEPSPVAWLPEKEIWRHQRWFSTAGFNSWISLLCHLWGCIVAEMGANYLLDIPNPHGLARGYCRQPE